MTFVEAANWFTVSLAAITAFAWIKAATSTVRGNRLPEAGTTPGEAVVIDEGEVGNPGSGGIFMSGRDGWIDIPKSMRLQATWNARAAWLSAATAGCQALALLAARFNL